MDEQVVVSEVAQGAEPVPAPTPKRGETPRQQIHKAKTVSRRQFSAEEKIRIVMEGIRGNEPVSVVCRRQRVHTRLYYQWLKDFMEAGKRRLRRDVQREANRTEVQSLRDENARLKRLVAEYALDVMAVKKACWWSEPLRVETVAWKIARSSRLFVKRESQAEPDEIPDLRLRGVTPQ